MVLIRPCTESCIGLWIPSLGSSTKFGSTLGQIGKIILTVLGPSPPFPAARSSEGRLPIGIRNCYNEINGVDQDAPSAKEKRRVQPMCQGVYGARSSIQASNLIAQQQLPLKIAGPHQIAANFVLPASPCSIVATDKNRAGRPRSSSRIHSSAFPGPDKIAPDRFHLSDCSDTTTR
jgi:hypothetical protein